MNRFHKEGTTICAKKLVLSLLTTSLCVFGTPGVGYLGFGLGFRSPLSHAADATEMALTNSAVVKTEVNKVKPPKAVRPFAYSVEMLDPPEMLPRSHPKGEDNLLKKLVNTADVLLIGR